MKTGCDQILTWFVPVIPLLAAVAVSAAGMFGLMFLAENSIRLAGRK